MKDPLRRHLDRMLEMENSRKFLLRNHKNIYEGKEIQRGPRPTISCSKLRRLFSERENFQSRFPESLSSFKRFYSHHVLNSMSSIASTFPKLIFNYSAFQHHLNKLIIITASCWSISFIWTSEILNFSAFLTTTMLPSLNFFSCTNTIICLVSKSTS